MGDGLKPDNAERCTAASAAGIHIMKVFYNLSAKARQEQFVATGVSPDQRQFVEFDPASLSPMQRAALVSLLMRSGDGRVRAEVELQTLQPKTMPWNERTTLVLDAPPTSGEIIAHLLLTIVQDAQDKEWMAAHDQAQREAKAERDAVVERMRLAEEERQKAATKVAEERAAEKLRWAEAHGSDHLKRALDRGHNSQRLYVTERAAKEAPGFVVDFDDSAQWKSRATPSVRALDAADAADALGIGESEIVWLTTPAMSGNDTYDFDSREAIVIREYLGKYDLVQEV